MEKSSQRGLNAGRLIHCMQDINIAIMPPSPAMVLGGIDLQALD